MMKKIAAAAAVVALIVVLAAAMGTKKNPGSGSESEKISIAGSTALLPLMKQAAAEYMQAHPNVTVEVNGGGSFTGLNLVSEGSADIGASDVEAPSDYKDKNLVGQQVVAAPFVIIANPGVAVNSLSQEQLVGIFTGKITNWNQVGGENASITVISRARSSGSRATIKDTVLKGQEFTDNAVIQDSNGALKAAVAATPGAIGYVDAPYVDETVKALGYNGVQYSPEAVKAGQYPIYATPRLYTKGQPSGEVKGFIELVLSQEFQNKYVAPLGFIPLAAVPGSK